ncbi:TNT domain-containing protein [Clostridium felsineum]|uniref:TNT domain-containing protein n=1 Tax=Clostridium felsineum TaxID=36839 RepID=UPI0009D10EA7|nr:TNT domain-containing protein [Clostridium felsineum]URZ18357.1 hypothetical protein CLFE_044270 [Clostridium felsineum DSM 794]
MADKIKMEYMIMDSMTSEFRKMGGNLDNITKDLNKILVSLELSYISAASLIMCQNITDSLKIGKQITNNIYKLSIKLNDAKVAFANSDKDLAAAMGLASGAVLYRGNDDEDLNKVLKETDKTTKEVDGLLKEFDKFEKEEEIEKKAWYNKPAKEDIFDKVEYWFTGKKPRVRTQGEEVIAAQYTEMAFSNQNFAAELQSEFEIGARGLASMDRINEVMENSEEMPVVNVGKNQGISNINNKYSLSGQEHYDALKSIFGNGNVEWTSRNTISNYEKLKLSNWSWPPNDELYLKYKDVYNNDLYYNQVTGNINWPPNNGFVDEFPGYEILNSGILLDRYGEPTGNFFAPASDSYEIRALAPHSETANHYYYRATKDFEVTSGKAAPWFGSPGGAKQYIKYNEDGKIYTINELMDKGLIEDITDMVKKGLEK